MDIIVLMNLIQKRIPILTIQLIKVSTESTYFNVSVTTNFSILEDN